MPHLSAAERELLRRIQAAVRLSGVDVRASEQPIISEFFARGWVAWQANPMGWELTDVGEAALAGRQA